MPLLAVVGVLLAAAVVFVVWQVVLGVLVVEGVVLAV